MNTEEVKDVVVDEAVENAAKIPMNVRGATLLGVGVSLVIGGLVYLGVKKHNDKKKEQSIEEPVVDGQVAEA